MASYTTTTTERVTVRDVTIAQLQHALDIATQSEQVSSQQVRDLAAAGAGLTQELEGERKANVEKLALVTNALPASSSTW